MSPRPALPLRLEYILLGLIRRQPIHGYKILQHWNDPDGIGIIWRVKPGHFYAALEKLKQLGYLALTLTPGDAFPLRKEYQITPVGDQVFLNWMQTPVASARDFRQEFLAKLYFSEDVESCVLKELFHQQKFAYLERLNSLKNQLDVEYGFERQVTTFRIRQIQFILGWLQELAPTS